MFKRIKANKWPIITMVLVIIMVTGYLYQDARTKKLVNKANEVKKIVQAENEILKTEIEIEKKGKAKLLIEKTDIKKRYEEAKNNPPRQPKPKPEIRYLPSEPEIRYVKADNYEETEDNLSDCIVKFNRAISIIDDLDVSFSSYVFKSDRIEEKKDMIIGNTEKIANSFELSMNKIAQPRNRIYSSMTISLLTFDAGMYHGQETMQYYQNIGMETHPNHEIETKAIQFDTKFYFIKVSFALFRKDIIRKDLF